MTKPYSQREIALLCLQDGSWVKSHLFVRTDTPYGWLGIEGRRRVGELVERGQAEQRMVDGRAEYRITDAGRICIATLYESRASKIPDAALSTAVNQAVQRVNGGGNLFEMEAK
jgi:hypothetical protein